jgi:hypothetical protein
MPPLRILHAERVRNPHSGLEEVRPLQLWRAGQAYRG